MASSPFSSKSSMIDTPVCDSDEEVFVGPVTSKELQKASQLKRRTQFYFPSFDWKPSISQGEQNVTKTKEAVIDAVAAVDTQPVKLSLSADSLDSQSFLTTSEKPEDSSKGEYWSALSGDSCGSQTSINEGHLYSQFSADSLDSEQAPSTVKKCPPKFERHVATSPSSRVALSFHTNISEDSLEDSSKQLLNDGKLVSGFSGLSSSELKSNDSSMVQESLPLHSEEHLQNVTYVRNENDELSQVIVPEVLSDSLENESGNVASASKKSSNYLGDNTYSLDTESYDLHIDTDAREEDSNDCLIIDPENDKSDEPAVITDKDGGFLSILSEAALYHASQQKVSENTPYHGHEESSSTTQSLEDRFKVFGIDAGALEGQQLSNSIMYTTGRESNGLYSDVDNNTFYTGRNSIVGFSVRNFDGPMSQTALSSVNDGSSISSLGVQQLSSFGEQSKNVNMSSGSQVSAKSESNVLNQPIQNCAFNSTGSSIQDTDELSDQPQVNIVGTGTLNDSSKYQRESMHISGIYPLNSYLSENDSYDEYKGTAHDDLQPSPTPEEYLREAPHDNSEASSYRNEGTRESLHNDSGASSNVGELNDTLEEYEMMMKYGVDYILGRKGNKKGNCTDSEKNLKSDSGFDACKSPMYQEAKQNSSGSSMEYLDAVEASPNKKQLTRVKEPKVLSPLQKQLTKSTPQKLRDMQCLSAKTRNLKIPSKLPRAASAIPTKPLLTPSPQKTRHITRPMTFSEPKISSRPATRPVTPSSEAKLNTFKKPIAPAIPVSRLPKTGGIHHTPKSNNKILEKIQSPVGAYIHNSPSPVLVTNVKAKTSDRASYEKEVHAKALWRAGEMKSSIPRPGGSQTANCENLNPNVGCGLPAVKYTKAPCIKLDEASKSTIPRVGERMTKLLDAPSPQVIKHEGRLRVNCGSPQLAAKMQSMADTFDDSLIDIHSVSGDISVCVSQTACRTNTLGH